MVVALVMVIRGFQWRHPNVVILMVVDERVLVVVDKFFLVMVVSFTGGVFS